MDGNKQTDGIDGVSDATKCKSNLYTETVDESTTEETKDCKGTVQSNVLKRNVRWNGKIDVKIITI